MDPKNLSILSRAICRGAPQIRWREDCAMEMAIRKRLHAPHGARHRKPEALREVAHDNMYENIMPGPSYLSE